MSPARYGAEGGHQGVRWSSLSVSDTRPVSTTSAAAVAAAAVAAVYGAARSYRLAAAVMALQALRRPLHHPPGTASRRVVASLGQLRVDPRSQIAGHATRSTAVSQAVGTHPGRASPDLADLPESRQGLPSAPAEGASQGGAAVERVGTSRQPSGRIECDVTNSAQRTRGPYTECHCFGRSVPSSKPLMRRHEAQRALFDAEGVD